MTAVIEPKGLDITDGMRRRRMHREFEDRPVPSEVLDKMAWAASRAQQARSGVRTIVVVDDPVLMGTARHVLPGFMTNAPAMLVLCSDLSEATERMGSRGIEHSTRLDAGAACSYLSLMAPALGLGICTITSWTDAAVRSLLGLPEHLRPDVTVAIGYVPPSPPKPLTGFKTSFYYNGFGEEFTKGTDRA
jgi:nitroreductase